MLIVDFLWARPIGDLVKDDFDDFGIRVVDPGAACVIQPDMSSCRGLHRFSPALHYFPAYNTPLGSASKGKVKTARMRLLPRAGEDVVAGDAQEGVEDEPDGGGQELAHDQAEEEGAEAEELPQAAVAAHQRVRQPPQEDA